MKSISEFKTKSALKKYVQELIAELGECNSVRNKSESTYQWFLELFKRHSDYPRKIDGIIDIFVQKNHSFKHLELHILKENHETDDISWVNCVEMKKKPELIGALRNAILPQIIEFKNTQKHVCAICQCNDSNTDFHADHVKHFEKLTYDFLSLHPETPSSFDSKIDNTKSFKVDDQEFEMAWVNYHKQQAILQILCKTCNLKREKFKK